MDIPKVNFKPAYDGVLVKRIEKDIKEAAGVLIPENAKERPTEAIVIAKGNGRFLPNGIIQEVAYAVGDRVLIGKYAGIEVTIEGEKFHILREDDIFGHFTN